MLLHVGVDSIEQFGVDANLWNARIIRLIRISEK